MKEEVLDTHSKALKINLDPRWYGTFAEIGAGQEVVRWFFRVGGAAGTVAKSMSAYDMKVSDAIYEMSKLRARRNERVSAIAMREGSSQRGAESKSPRRALHGRRRFGWQPKRTG